MIRGIDTRINAIFDAHEQMNRAVVLGKSPPPGLLDQALAASCLLVREVIADEVVASLRAEQMAIDVLRELRKQNKLGLFLETERALLAMTKLNPDLIERIIAPLSRLSEVDAIPTDWRDRLGAFANAVCTQAKSTAKDGVGVPLLKRIVIVGGGAMVALLNVMPPISLAPGVAPLSVYAGVWLMQRAAENQVSNWLEK